MYLGSTVAALFANCSNSCAACEIRLQFCIAGANESGTSNPFVNLLRNAQIDFSIIWTNPVAIRLKKNNEKTDLDHFRLSFSFP